MSRNLQHEALRNVKSSRNVRRKLDEDSVTYFIAVLSNTSENGVKMVVSEIGRDCSIAVSTTRCVQDY